MMPEKPKVHFQVKCDNLPLCGFEGRCSASNDWYMVDCSDCLDKNLTYLKWKREGAKAERERIWVLWRDTTRETNCTEDALVLFNNRLKAELEK